MTPFAYRQDESQRLEGNDPDTQIFEKRDSRASIYPEMASPVQSYHLSIFLRVAVQRFLTDRAESRSKFNYGAEAGFSGE